MPVLPGKPAPFSKSPSALAWEQAWQQELDAVYLKTNIAVHKATWAASRNFLASSDARSESRIAVFLGNHRALCQLQRDLLHFAAEMCAVDHFEHQWRVAGPTAREKHYFEAMKRVCDMPDLEEQRWWAPEICLARFQAENGQGYLDLLRALMPEQILPNQYVRIEHPAVDAQFGICGPLETSDALPTDPLAISQRMHDITRCLFMSLVVWHTLLSFYGRFEQTVPLRSESNSDLKLAPSRVAQLERRGMSNAIIQAIAKDQMQMQKQSQWLCAYCGKFESQSESKLKSCSQCRAIKRHVMYCSRDCQVNDWKNGNPPHKTTCGKPTSEILTTPVPMATTSRTAIPPPAPNYRRSIALVHQISQLEDSSADYWFIPPPPLPDIGVSLADPMLSQRFRIIRDYAFQTGDKEAVGVMFHLLGDMARSRTEFGLHGLEMQLRAEFGMDSKELREQVVKSLTRTLY